MILRSSIDCSEGADVSSIRNIILIATGGNEAGGIVQGTVYEYVGLAEYSFLGRYR